MAECPYCTQKNASDPCQNCGAGRTVPPKPGKE